MLNKSETPAGARPHRWERKAATVHRCQGCRLEVLTEPNKAPADDYDGGCRPRIAATGEHCWHPSGTQFTCCRCRAARTNAGSAGLFGCAVETDRCTGEQVAAEAK